MACTGKRKGTYTACIEDISRAGMKSMHSMYENTPGRHVRRENQVYADADAKIPGKKRHTRIARRTMISEAGCITFIHLLPFLVVS